MESYEIRTIEAKIRELSLTARDCRERVNLRSVYYSRKNGGLAALIVAICMFVLSFVLLFVGIGELVNENFDDGTVGGLILGFYFLLFGSFVPLGIGLGVMIPNSIKYSRSFDAERRLPKIEEEIKALKDSIEEKRQEARKGFEVNKTVEVQPQVVTPEPVVAEPVKTETPVTRAPLTNEQIDQLTKINQLHKDGVLTDAEFAEQKTKILG